MKKKKAIDLFSSHVSAIQKVCAQGISKCAVLLLLMTLAATTAWAHECETCSGTGNGACVASGCSNGFTKCLPCSGTASFMCNMCQGSGQLTMGMFFYPCTECDGNGRVACDTCNGSGKTKCASCKGTGLSEGTTCSTCLGMGLKGGGSSSNPYQISTADELIRFADKVNGDNGKFGSACAILTNDIVVNDGTFGDGGVFTAIGESEPSEPKVVTPIGRHDYVTDTKYYYNGIFDGRGNTISGLYYAGSEDNSEVGLFGHLGLSARIYKLGVVNAYFSVSGKGSFVGGIAAVCDGEMSNCYSTGVLIDGSDDKDAYVGGVCGKCNNSIKNCHSVINVTRSLRVDGVSNGRYTTCYSPYTSPATSLDEFASGYVCNALNRVMVSSMTYQDGPTDGTQAWYQNLSPDGDAYPVLKRAEDNSNTVYHGYLCDKETYANYELSATPQEHIFNKTVLSATADESGLYEYACDNGCGTLDDGGLKVIKDFAPNAEGAARNLDLNVYGNAYYADAVDLTDANQFKGVNVEFVSDVAPTFSREMTYEWGTLVLPFAISSMQDGFDFYEVRTLDAGDNTIVLRKITGADRGIIPAGLPVFVRRTGESTQLSLTAADKTVNTAISDNGALKGTYADIALTKSDAGSYFIYSNTLCNASILGESQKAKVTPFHAYLAAGSESSMAKLRLVVEDDATGISQTGAAGSRIAKGVYNLMGQKLSAPQKGVNIIDGKKVMK